MSYELGLETHELLIMGVMWIAPSGDGTKCGSIPNFARGTLRSICLKSAFPSL